MSLMRGMLMLSRVDTEPPIAGFLLMPFERQGELPVNPNLETQLDGLLNVLQAFFSRSTLADTSRDGRAFSNPYPIFIAVESYGEPHDRPPQSLPLPLET